MDYKSMIAEAKSKGLTSEEKMWESIKQLGESLAIIKESNPEMYWNIMRTQHGIMFNRHYSEEFAKHDVDQIFYTDADGKEHEGAYWTMDEIKDILQKHKHPSDVNIYDAFVAYNVMYADLNKKFSDEQIVDAAYLFFFMDEDWSDEDDTTKIWDYMYYKNQMS